MSLMKLGSSIFEIIRLLKLRSLPAQMPRIMINIWSALTWLRSEARFCRFRPSRAGSSPRRTAPLTSSNLLKHQYNVLDCQLKDIWYTAQSVYEFNHSISVRNRISWHQYLENGYFCHIGSGYETLNEKQLLLVSLFKNTPMWPHISFADLVIIIGLKKTDMEPVVWSYIYIRIRLILVS